MVLSLKTVDSGVNLSDHIPLCLVLCVNHVNSDSDIKPDFLSSRLPDFLLKRLRWNKADLSWYYTNTYGALSKLSVPTSFACAESVSANQHTVRSDIEHFYNSLIASLRMSANSAVPSKKGDFLSTGGTVNWTVPKVDQFVLTAHGVMPANRRPVRYFWR